MSYIFKQKFHISELVPQERAVKKILIAESDSFLGALFAYHLSSEDYHVKSCNQLDAVHRHLASFAPHLLIINPGLVGGAAKASHAFRQAKQAYPHLLIVTVSFDSGSEEVKHLMAAGVNAHVDRRFTKPQDVVRIINTLL